MGKYVLQRIDVGSAFKVGAVLYGLFSAIIGLFVIGFYALIFGLGFASFGANSFTYYSGSYYSGLGLDSAGLIAICGASVCAYLISIVSGAISGGIIGALLAIFYNLTVRWVGGLQMEFANMGVSSQYYAPDKALYAEIERDLKG